MTESVFDSSPQAEAATNASAGPIATMGLRRHPRLLLEGLEGLRHRISSDPLSARWYAQFRADADAILELPPSRYEIPDGKRLLATSRQVMRRSYLLSMAYLIEGDRRYADRLWLELDTACGFPDWNPSHFLDVGEMAHGVSIGYDWLYDHWSAEQRSVLESALVRHALEPGLEAHQSTERRHWWTRTTTNWNLVCNGGLTLAALAVGDVDTDVADQVLAATLSAMPEAVRVYQPDGAYPEGQAYWSYGTTYLVLAAAAYTTATGRPDTITDVPSISEAGMFPIHLAGPLDRSFNYYDGHDAPSRPSEMFWLGRRFPDHPVYIWWATLGSSVREIDYQQLPTNLLWYRPDSAVDPITAQLPLDSYFRSSEVVTMRNAWCEVNAVWLGAKAGDNATAHSDLDLGTFVLDALGHRWISDFGSDNYNLPGYFDIGSDGDRWGYYRKRTEGHNTVLVDPTAHGGQSYDDTDRPSARRSGVGEIVSRGSTPTEAFAVADLTRAYPNLRSWRRGWRLFDCRRQVVVQDELTLTSPAEVWTFWHTPAPIRIAADGRSAVLAREDAELHVQLLEPVDATLCDLEAAPLWTSPDPSGQATNSGTRKLAIRIGGVTEARVVVQLTPLRPGQPQPAAEPVRPLAQWSTSAPPHARLRSLRVNGVELSRFQPDQFTYHLDTPEVGDVIASAAASDSVRVQPADNSGAVAVEVTGPDVSTTCYQLYPLPRPHGDPPSSSGLVAVLAEPLGLNPGDSAEPTLRGLLDDETTVDLADSTVEFYPANSDVATADGRIVTAVGPGVCDLAVVVTTAHHRLVHATTSITVVSR